MAPSDRHLSLVTSTPRAGADTGGDPNLDSSPGHQPASSCSVPPGENVVVSGSSRCGSYTLRLRRAPNLEHWVLVLDQPPLATSPLSSAEIEPTAAALAQVAVALHPFARGRMARQHGERVLRWPARDFRLERSRPTRSTQPDRADAGRRRSVPRFRLLRLLARRAMAQYLATLSRVPLGPLRTW